MNVIQRIYKVIYKFENITYGEINKRIFSNPHLKKYGRHISLPIIESISKYYD